MSVASRSQQQTKLPKPLKPPKPTKPPKAATPSIKPQKPSTKEPPQKPPSVQAAAKKPAASRSEKERQKVTDLLLSDDDPSRLVRDYPFRAKSLEFRKRFDDLVARAYVWVPRSPDTFHELLGAISQAVAFFGFEEASISSTHSAQYSTITSAADLSDCGLDLNETRLSLLWIRPPEYTWSQLRNYLVYRQVDSQHEGIINKWLLIANLKGSDERLNFTTQSGGRFTSEHFLPRTFSLDMPMDELISVLAASQGTYIIKEVRGTKGRNMNLLRLSSRRSSGSHQQQDLLEMLKTSGILEHRLPDVILQKYIERPLLVDKRKFDFRVYMLMVNACRKERSGVRKAFHVFYHPGFLRLCIMAYQRDSGDLLCHLTNQHVQMGSILYDQYKEATVWEPDELNQYFNAKATLPTRDYVRDVVYPKIGAIVGYLGAAFADSLNDSTIQANTFKMFGVDFLVDSRLTVQLLEVNELPSWKRQTKLLARLKTDLWREAIALTAETVVKHRQAEPLLPLLSQCNFRLVYSTEEPTLLADAVAKHFA